MCSGYEVPWCDSTPPAETAAPDAEALRALRLAGLHEEVRRPFRQLEELMLVLF